MTRAAWLALVLALAPLAPAAHAAPPAREMTETKERLTPEEMEALVAKPLALARAGDMQAADAALEQLLEERRRRYGPDSVQVADTLVTFMVLAYNERQKRAAMAYGPRALDATRRAWGSDHLEYALVLNDLVVMDYEINRAGVSREAEGALMEAYRIRADRLGPTHRETISTLVYLGLIQGQRSRTGGDLARAGPAIATLNRAIALSERHGGPDETGSPWARSVLAETYARNGALDQSVRTLAKMLELGRERGVDVSGYGFFVASAMEEGGFSEQGQALSKALLEATGILPATAPEKGPD